MKINPIQLAEDLCKALDESWEKSSIVKDEDRNKVFLQYAENKLQYMKSEGFIAGYTMPEVIDKEEN
jgi:hypothetical protein